MKKLFRRLILLGALTGVAVAVRGYLQRPASGEEVVQIVFDDGSTQILTSDSAEAQEFTDIARELVEMGV